MAHRPEEVYYGSRQGEALPPDVYKIRGLTMREAVRQLGEQRVKQVFRKLYVDHLLSMDTMGKILKKSKPTIMRYIHRFGITPRTPVMIKLGKVVELYNAIDQERVCRELVDTELAEVYYLYPDPDLEYLCGFTLGDGSVYQYRVRICNTEFSLLPPIEKMADRVSRRLRIKYAVHFYDENMRRVETAAEAHSWVLTMYSVALARLLSTREPRFAEENIKTLLRHPTEDISSRDCGMLMVTQRGVKSKEGRG